MRLSEDREHIIFHNLGRPQIWKQRTYSLAELRESATVCPTLLHCRSAAIVPVAMTDFAFADENAIEAAEITGRLPNDLAVWHLWPGFQGARYQTSNFSMARLSGAKRWRISHYYVSDIGPCTRSPSSVTLQDPVLLNDGFPMVAFAFNLVCYIENVQVTVKKKKVENRRIAKVACIVDSVEDGEDGETSFHVKELDIPAEVLSEAHGLDYFYISKSSSLLVTTSSNIMHLYRYA